jgi:hypothetical protein
MIAMNKPYLEVTYRQGKPFAAYLYLPRRPGDSAARTERHGRWLIDRSGDGRIIGIEFPSAATVDITELNRMLAECRQEQITVQDLAPLSAA